jgi:predicted ATPase/DNA-binding winged helix-turn-helix (wHTH) protein
LRAAGKTVPIGSRAFEIIEKLAGSAGQFVGKDELVAHVWRGAIVDENTLRVHIHAIRKALGSDRTLLKTDAGRGYRLLGPWSVKQDDSRPPESQQFASLQARGQPARTNVPAATSDVVGRSASLRLVKDLISAFRVVTLAGPGGIGKTTLALELARDLLDEFNHSVFFVELSPLSESRLVPLTVARALGLSVDGKELPVEDVARAIGSSKVLLVLDNCEHLIDATARLAETIVRWCPHASILVTSREVMKIDGERVYRLPPLEVPESHHAHPEHLLECSAVELFVKRTQSLSDGFTLNTGNSAAVATICRHLDGIPLAIEFAAGRTATLGVQQVVGDLRDRLGLLASRRRTAVPRHKTLRAVLDWSYDLLSPPEQKFLRSLAVFSGPFNLDDAGAIAAPLEAADWLSGLVDKSLVASEMRDSTTLYRLLDTTRTYALEKLKECDELGTVGRLHAQYHRDLFERIEPEWQTRITEELRADYAWRLDNLRAAIAWAFSEEHTAPVGVAMANAAIPLWMHLSLFDECRNYLRQALLRTTAVNALPPERQMRLYAAYGIASLYSGGDPTIAESACEQALNIADRIGDVDQQLRCLWGLWLVRRGSLDLARRFLAMAVKPVDEIVGHRMMATSLHVRGNQSEARPHVDAIVANPTILAADPKRFRFLVTERPVSQEPGLARVLWAQGCPDQAMRLVRESIETVKAASHANSLCHFVALAGCLVTLWAGHLDEAKQYIALLSDQSNRYGLVLWNGWSLGYRGMFALQVGNAAEGVDFLRAAVDELRALHEWRGYVFFPLCQATALGRLGRVEEALDLIDSSLDSLDTLTEGWMHPELLRAKGDLLLLQKTSSAQDHAERLFNEALEEARHQGALAWQLRAATSLARLLQGRDRRADARKVLQPIYDQYQEGFDTYDVTSANALLKDLN